MMQVWDKLGKIYCPDGSMWWAKTHAYQPTPILLEDRIRLYIACYDYNKTGIFYRSR